MRRSFACSAIATSVVFSCSGFAWGGTIRHDRDDARYLERGSLFDTTGMFSGTTSSSSYIGSGVLIAPHWAVTAAHVVDQATSLAFALGGTKWTASSWVHHPNWTGDLAAGYDIALVHFGTSLTEATGITAASRYTGSKETGKTAAFSGYGRTGTGLTGHTALDGQRRSGYNTLDRLYDTSGRYDRILLADFDSPTTSADSAWGSSVPLDLEYLIAPGDSGGGVFLNSGDGWLLAGVHSFGWGVLDGDPNSDYGDASGHTRVSAFNKWIEDTIGTGGSTGDDGGGSTKPGNGGGRPFVADVPEPTSLAVLSLTGVLLLRRRGM